MQVLRLAIRHTCPFSGPVASSRSARVTHLCHRGVEAILEVHDPDAAELEALVETYRALGGTVLLRSEDGTSSMVRFPSCACCRGARVIPTMEAGGHLYLPPSVYRSGGEEVYQFLGRGERIDPALLRDLPSGIEIVSTGVRPLSSPEFEGGFLVPVGGLFQGITPRQRTAVVNALRRGYYRIPRPVTTAELAQDLGISREAYDALLRKGENKLLSALFPYLVLPEGREGAAPVPPAPEPVLERTAAERAPPEAEDASAPRPPRSRRRR